MNSLTPILALAVATDRQRQAAAARRAAIAPTQRTAGGRPWRMRRRARADAAVADLTPIRSACPIVPTQRWSSREPQR
jgi:hypothetical protein